jgi:hypothetical protein
MQQNNKKITYNTKISKENFELLQAQSASRNQNELNVIESRFLGGSLGGLQSRLRLSMNAEESISLKQSYKARNAITSGSSIDSSFKTRGVDRLLDVGYFKDNL